MRSSRKHETVILDQRVLIANVRVKSVECNWWQSVGGREGKNQVSWGCKNKSRANTWLPESWKVRSPVTHLEYPKRCAEVFICPRDRRHDHYSLSRLSLFLSSSLAQDALYLSLCSSILLPSLLPSLSLTLSFSSSLCTCPIISLLFRATNTAYIYMCVCVSDARKTAKQRKNRAPDTAGSQWRSTRCVVHLPRNTAHTNAPGRCTTNRSQQAATAAAVTACKHSQTMLRRLAKR